MSIFKEFDQQMRAYEIIRIQYGKNDDSMSRKLVAAVLRAERCSWDVLHLQLNPWTVAFGEVPKIAWPDTE